MIIIIKYHALFQIQPCFGLKQMFKMFIIYFERMIFNHARIIISNSNLFIFRYFILRAFWQQ
jgi:hypothetical protein